MRTLLPVRFPPGGAGTPETERMTTAPANVLGPLVPNLVGCDEMTPHYARQWMPDYSHPSFCFDERVSTNARVFSECLVRCHYMDAMSQESACVADSFRKFASAGVGVPEQFK